MDNRRQAALLPCNGFKDSKEVNKEMGKGFYAVSKIQVSPYDNEVCLQRMEWLRQRELDSDLCAGLRFAGDAHPAFQ
jgi:hypothetical protein